MDMIFGLVDELVPGLVAMVDDVVLGFEDPIGEPVVALELSDAFLRVEFGRLAGSGIRVMLEGTRSLPERCLRLDREVGRRVSRARFAQRSRRDAGSLPRCRIAA